MTEGYRNRVQLEGEQLAQARRARQAVAENLKALREIVLTALEIDMSTDQAANFAPRPPRSTADGRGIASSRTPPQRRTRTGITLHAAHPARCGLRR